MVHNEYQVMLRVKGSSAYVESGSITVPRYDTGHEFSHDKFGENVRVRVDDQTDGDATTGVKWEIYLTEV